MRLADKYENGDFNSLFYFGFVLILTLNVACAIYWLNAESLWIDELFTAYFADPAQQTISAVFTRTLEDVHPPGYYLLTWATARFSEIDFTTISRAQSLFFGVLALLVIYRAFPPGIKTYSRLFSLAAAVTSIAWLQFAMDARSYTLVFLISALFVLVGFKVVDRLSKQQIPVLLLAYLIALGIIGSLIHYYLLLLAGSVVGMLLLLSVNWPQRFSLVGVGLAILIPVAIFVKWHTDFIVLDVADTWFSMNFEFVRANILGGFAGVVGSMVQRILIVGIVVLCIVLYLKSAKDQQPDQQITRIYLFAIGCCLAPVLLALAVSFLYTPMFSLRVFTVSMPFYWVLIGLVSNALMAQLPKSNALYVAAISLLTLLSVSLYRFYDHGIPSNENWRDSATFVDGFTRCKGEIIPVVGFDKPVISVGETKISYAYYLKHRDEGDFLEIPLQKNYGDLAQTTYHKLVSARISDAEKCPVLIWSVHHWFPPPLAAFVADLRKHNSLPEGRTIKVKKFEGHSFVVIVE